MSFRRTSRSLLVVVVMLLMSAASFGQIGIGVSINIGPPALPVYTQPPCPSPGYIWTPGYWAYGPYGYYWVPGTWVIAPRVGFLWTPPWWGWTPGGFLFHAGYWGPTVGFYGGISYGFGYFGHGFEGGYWNNGQYFYNRSVTNVSVTNIRNVYNTTVINNNTTINRVSYNGGEGGITAHPTPSEDAAARQEHIAPTSVQTHHAQAALTNPDLRADVNHGRPSIAATPRPGAFHDRAAVAAKEAGAPYKGGNENAERNVPRPGNNVRPENTAMRSEGNAPRPGSNVPRPEGTSLRAENNAPRPENNVPRPPSTFHAKDLPASPRPAPVNTGNARLDQRLQKQQNDLYAKQQQEHDRLVQRQEQDHQRLAKQNASQARMQQIEEQHQRQTQQMEERHTQQLAHLQASQQRAMGRSKAR